MSIDIGAEIESDSDININIDGIRAKILMNSSSEYCSTTYTRGVEWLVEEFSSLTYEHTHQGSMSMCTVVVVPYLVVSNIDEKNICKLSLRMVLVLV